MEIESLLFWVGGFLIGFGLHGLLFGPPKRKP